jgi:VRR-NUC domain
MSGARHRGDRPEDAIQRAVTQHYRHRAAAGVFMFAVPNGGYRRPIEAAILKATGTVAGVPDTIWIKDGRVFAIELKAPGGRLSDVQLATMAEMREAGAVVAVATGIDEALCKLENLGLLRGRSA